MGKINWNTESKKTVNYKPEDMDRLLDQSDYKNDFNPTAGFDWTPYQQDNLPMLSSDNEHAGNYSMSKPFTGGIDYNGLSSTDVVSDTLLPALDNSNNDSVDYSLPMPSNWYDNFQNEADKFIKSNPITSFLAKAGQSAANVMTNGGALQDNYDTGSKVANTAADFLGTGLGFAERLPGLNFSVGNAMNKTIGQSAENVLTNLADNYGINSKLADYTIQALKSGAEFGGYEGLNNAIQGKDVGQGIGEGFGQGMLWGTAGKALGELTHVIAGIGKIKILKDDGNNVTFQDEKGNVQDMNKTIFNNTVQSLDTMNPTYSHTNLDDVFKPNEMLPNKPIESKLPTLDASIPLENKMPSIDLKNPNEVGNQIPSMGDVKLNEVDGIKRGKFIDNSVENSGVTPQAVKDNFADNPDYYIPKNNPEVWDKAQNDVNANFNKEKNTLISQQSMETADDTAKALAIYKKYIQDGDMQGATEWASQISGKIRNTAQALQFMSTLKKFTPEWTLQKMQSNIEKTWTKKQQEIMANASVGEKANVAKLNNIPFLSEETSQNLTDMSIKISNMEDGRAKNEAIAKMNQYAKEQLPSSVLSKINSYHLIAMLSSPKTAIRNIVSNLAYSGVSDVKNVIRTGIDKGIGLVTGERTSTLPMLGDKLQGLKEGTNEAWLDFKHDVDTRNSNKFDMNQGSAFSKGPLHQMERAERLMMSDRPFEGMAYAEEFARQKKLAQMNGKEFNEADAIEKAKKVAAENTFTDNNKLSDLAVTLQRKMNFGKDFGLGSVVLRFARTPSSIAMRAIDHSPVAFARALKSAVGKEGFNQEAFADNLAKGTTGAGIMYLGYQLSKLGLISTDSEKNTNAQNLQSAAGLGQFKINLSGLNRFMNGGDTSLQKGDLHASWDFLQPLSVLMSVGAGLASRDENVSSATESLASNLLNGFNTLVDQPMTQGLQKLFGTHDFGKAAESFVAALPPSFVPSIVNNLRQITDNQARETYDPSIFKQGLNQAVNRIPMLEQQLPPKIDIMGQPKETYQNGSNSPLNVLVNPAITTQYLPTPAVENALTLYNQKGEAKALPDLVNKKPTIDGVTYQLTPEELNKWQQYIGNKANELYGIPKTADDIPMLTSQLTKINEQAKVQFLKDRGLPVPKTIQQKADSKIRTKKKGK